METAALPQTGILYAPGIYEQRPGQLRDFLTVHAQVTENSELFVYDVFENNAPITRFQLIDEVGQHEGVEWLKKFADAAVASFSAHGRFNTILSSAGNGISIANMSENFPKLINMLNNRFYGGQIVAGIEYSRTGMHPAWTNMLQMLANRYDGQVNIISPGPLDSLMERMATI